MTFANSEKAYSQGGPLDFTVTEVAVWAGHVRAWPNTGNYFAGTVFGPGDDLRSTGEYKCENVSWNNLAFAVWDAELVEWNALGNWVAVRDTFKKSKKIGYQGGFLSHEPIVEYQVHLMSLVELFS